MSARGNGMRRIMRPSRTRWRREELGVSSGVVAESISVVIPAWDEKGRVGDAVRSVHDDAEVIVVDGGSTDGTRAEAAAAGATVVASERGRGQQLAAGGPPASREAA